MSTSKTQAEELYRALLGATLLTDTRATAWEQEGRLPCLFWPIGIGPVSAMDPASLRTWLKDNRIEATVETVGREVKVEFADADSGHRLAELLRAPAARTKTLVAQLEEALALHQIPSKVSPSEKGRIAVDIEDITDLPSAQNLARALGAEEIAEGLDLNRHRGQYEFGVRMRRVIEKAVGSCARYELHPDCRHTPSEIEMEFTEAQALKLIAVLTSPAGKQVAP